MSEAVHDVAEADRRRFLAVRAAVRPDPDGVAQLYARVREATGPVHAATLEAIERHVAARAAQPSS
ncbi:MAG: hypothetical protein R2749_00950 [Acidimicrobiales bacterium]